jgi:hypothetical protein
MSELYFTVEHLTTKELTRIFSKIKISTESFYQNSPCWEWTGSKRDDYGYVRWHRKIRRIHRVIYAWIFGPIPRPGNKMEIDHLCKNRSCTNPLHLELVTSRINSLRSNNVAARNAKKTHCPQGHPYDVKNTIPKNNGRWCRTCKNEEARLARQGDSERAIRTREKARIAQAERRALMKDDPEWQERRRVQKRAAYARYRQNPNWVVQERARLRALYSRQKKQNAE